MRKKTVFLFLLAISIVAVLYKLLWPVIEVYDVWEYVCYPYTVSSSYDAYYDGYPGYVWYEPESSYTAYDCGWVNHLIFVDVSSGGGTGWPPEEPNLGQDGVGSDGGWGQTKTQNRYDMDNDGFIDCWHKTLIRLDNIVPTQGYSADHPAIDFAGAGWDITNQSVYSATDGTVYNIAANETGACGWWIQIKADDGSLWKYCHLLDDPRYSVTLGQRVTAGMTVIGKADHTGECRGDNFNGAHLHIEIEVNGVLINFFDRIGDC